MPQKLIKIKGSQVGSSIFIDDLADVVVDEQALSDNSLLAYDPQSGMWKNVDITVITEIISRQTLLRSTNFTAATGFNYIIDVTNGPIQATLPSNPTKGSVVFLVDKYASTLGYTCDKGFSNNPVTLVCPSGYTISGNSSLMFSFSGSFVEVMYIGCETWKIISTNDPYKLYNHAKQTPIISQTTYTLQYSDWGKTLIFSPPFGNNTMDFVIPNISVPLGWWCEFETNFGVVNIVTSEILNARGRYLRTPNTIIRLVYTEVGWRASGPLNETGDE